MIIKTHKNIAHRINGLKNDKHNFNKSFDLITIRNDKKKNDNFNQLLLCKQLMDNKILINNKYNFNPREMVILFAFYYLP